MHILVFLLKKQQFVLLDYRNQQLMTPDQCHSLRLMSLRNLVGRRYSGDEYDGSRCTVVLVGRYVNSKLQKSSCRLEHILLCYPSASMPASFFQDLLVCQAHCVLSSIPTKLIETCPFPNLSSKGISRSWREISDRATSSLCTSYQRRIPLLSRPCTFFPYSINIQITYTHFSFHYRLALYPCRLFQYIAQLIPVHR